MEKIDKAEKSGDSSSFSYLPDEIVLEILRRDDEEEEEDEVKLSKKKDLAGDCFMDALNTYGLLLHCIKCLALLKNVLFFFVEKCKDRPSEETFGASIVPMKKHLVKPLLQVSSPQG
ncbi:hypothetical protein Tco_0562518 [Tanacetum coccineum]